MAESPAAVIRHRAAVIGSPVSHSLSPVLHRAAYAGLGLDDWSYERLETAPPQLLGLLADLAAPAQGGPAWAGLSVTMPHKQTLLAHLDVIDPLAEAVGAVNTVVAQRSGAGAALLAGFNTDVAGIVGALREASRRPVPGSQGDHLRVEQAVVLGSGATACSALAALGELKAGRITVVARRHAGPGRALSAAHRMGLDVETLTWKPTDPASNIEAVQLLATADVVISTLPAHAADPLVDPLRRALEQAGGTRPGAVMLDVVYAPWPTAVAGAWAHAGGALAPGWLMLLHQAVPQVQLMTGHQPDIECMRAALRSALAPASTTPLSTDD
ncbi:shikimate dehydrogenase [Actinomyces oris]|uniref:Shikimate dehydrogenase n=1 Tax=Actinomyces oris TaxID=544580 RepID=A0A1Q8VJZ1_9ACTO|nr:shikimate dehydrogenase [Actinomyces oris]